MKRTNIFLLGVLMTLFGLPLFAEAALVDMGDGTIYDTDTKLSWLKDAGAGGIKSRDEALEWAATLKVGGLTGWRLPNADPACGFNYNCYDSEIGRLYYVSLGNNAGRRTKDGPFTNLNPNPSNSPDLYWSGTTFEPDPPGAWLFNFYDGNQLGGSPGGSYSAWAVRPGARSQTAPVPAKGTDGEGPKKETK